MKTENKYFIFDKPVQWSLKASLIRLYYTFRAIAYKLYMFGIAAVPQDKKYNVSICAIFKNEAPYLKEWIEFNHLVGIEHFYMYNNNSEDDFRHILHPYIERGWVTLMEWPYNQMQMECYIDCIEKYSSDTKWLGFIDIDEFIVPKSTDNVYDFLKGFEKKAGAVVIYWKLFGTSGWIERSTDGHVTEDMIICWPKYCNVGKCFYNTAFEFDKKSKHTAGFHHWFWANWKGKDIPPVNAFKRISFGGWNFVKTVDFPIQINHYFTKSYKEYCIKKIRGDVYFEMNPHDEDFFYWHEMKCCDADYSAYKYLIKLKLVMGQTSDEQ